MNDLQALLDRISALPSPWKEHALERLSESLKAVERQYQVSSQAKLAQANDGCRN